MQNTEKLFTLTPKVKERLARFESDVIDPWWGTSAAIKGLENWAGRTKNTLTNFDIKMIEGKIRWAKRLKPVKQYRG